tara:strand:- start:97 stop:258 length:162 start_codon:yes stop_codon:yes gene_type:complete
VRKAFDFLKDAIYFFFFLLLLFGSNSSLKSQTDLLKQANKLAMDVPIKAAIPY